MLKSAIWLILLAIIPLSQIAFSLQSLQNTPTSFLPISVLTDSQGIYLSDQQSAESLARIAPYQDFIYRGEAKDSFNDIFQQTRQPNLVAKISRIINPNTWSWKTDQSGGTYSYNLKSTSKGIFIQRLISTKNPPSALGESLYYCPTCIVIGTNNNTVYTSNLDLTDPIIQKAKNLGYKVQKILANEIWDTPNVSILNLQSNKSIRLSLGENSQAHLFDRVHILEIKQPVSQLDSQTYLAVQEIIF